MAMHSSILAREMPWTEEPGRLQSTESQSWTQLKQLSTHAILLGKCAPSCKNALQVKTGWCPVHREKNEGTAACQLLRRPSHVYSEVSLDFQKSLSTYVKLIGYSL